MKKIIQNKLFKNYLSFLIPIFILEILFRILSSMSLFDWAVFRIFLGCNILSFLVAIFLMPINELVGKIISNILFFLATFYAILQAGFENYLGVYISFGASSQLGAVKEYISEYFHSFNPLFYAMAIPFLLFLIYKIIFEKKIFKSYFHKRGSLFEKQEAKKTTKLSIIILIIICIVYYSTLQIEFMQNPLQLESTKALFKNPNNPNISVNQFGVTTFGLLDIKTTLIKPEEEEVTYYEKPEEIEVTNLTRHIDDNWWQELAKNTTNKNYKTLNNYFMSRTISDKNEYTGTFKGKNLIVIMMESVNEIFINSEYYPTFYKLYTEGWSFTNSYSPRNSCATGNNEMSGMTSLFSIYRKCTANEYKNNIYSESIFNIFNRAGYKTSSYHNYTEKYYYRSIIHKNMGSGAYYGVNDLDISYNPEYSEWPSDIPLMEEAVNHIDTAKPFMAWITTVTSHQPYSKSVYGNKYLSLFENTNYPIELKRYMSKLKELDLALERLIERLKEENVLDDTVIVLYGDHYPYGLDNKDINYALPYDVNINNNIEKTPFVIYNSATAGKEFLEYTSYMNILPTLANLFDLDYDPRLYMGEDILAPNYKNSYKNRVILADGSWENRIGRYDATSGKIIYFGEETYSKEEVITYNKEINNLIKMSNLAITTNYFKYLSDGKKSYEESLQIEDKTN